MTEWRATEFKLEEDFMVNKKEIIEFFDWEHHFFAYLDVEKKGMANKELLLDILARSEW
jgi:hypothetical protein